MAYIHQIFTELSILIDPSIEREELINFLAKNEIDWEHIVRAGSKQLVLPAIYCNLNSKELLDHIPNDLCRYLEEITSINRNRNITLLEEIRIISDLFKTNQIEHVFLKGGALLVSGYYKDPGERMIGDIDVLVHPDQIFLAQELLLKQDYEEASKSLTDKYMEQKHLPRLISDSKLASVEIHRKLLHKVLKGHLSPINMLQNKQIIDSIAIPSPLDLLKHSVLNFHINDYGFEYNYLGLRSAFDTLILLPYLSKTDIESVLKHKIFRSYFIKMDNYFKNIPDYHKTWGDNIWNYFFLLKQKYKFPNTLWHKTVNIFKILDLILNRSLLFFTNPNYRKESFRDRKRIIDLIKGRI